jgi:hypothetical protein
LARSASRATNSSSSGLSDGPQRFDRLQNQRLVARVERGGLAGYLADQSIDHARNNVLAHARPNRVAGEQRFVVRQIGRN